MTHCRVEYESTYPWGTDEGLDLWEAPSHCTDCCTCSVTQEYIYIQSKYVLYLIVTSIRFQHNGTWMLVKCLQKSLKILCYLECVTEPCVAKNPGLWKIAFLCGIVAATSIKSVLFPCVGSILIICALQMAPQVRLGYRGGHKTCFPCSSIQWSD